MALVGGRTGVGGARARTRCKQSCFYAQWLSLLCWSGAVAGGIGAGAGTPEGAGFSRVWWQSHLGLGQRRGLRPWGPTSVLVLLSPQCVPSVRGWCHATELTPPPPLRPPEGICPAAMTLTLQSVGRDSWAGNGCLHPGQSRARGQAGSMPSSVHTLAGNGGLCLRGDQHHQSKRGWSRSLVRAEGHPEAVPKHFATSCLCAVVGRKQTCAWPP